MKIIALFEAFQKKDWLWMQKFVESDLYNRHQGVQRLFSFFRKKWPLTPKELNSEILHKKIFPEEAFDAAKTHHLVNYLLKSTEDYLAWDAWQSDAFEPGFYLLQACRQRRIHRHFLEIQEKLEQKLEAQPLRDAVYCRNKYRLALEQYHHTLASGRFVATEQLQSFTNLHDIAFVSEKLKYACGMFSHQRLQKTSIDQGLLDAVIAYVRQRPEVLNHPAVGVYFHGYLALTEPQEDAHFFALKKHLDVSALHFNPAELRDIYLLAVNFCIHRINLRQEQFLREVFDLYRSGLDQGVFFENGELLRFTYTNIALTALRLKAFDWAYQFIEQYRDKLPETQRKGTYAFNLARYYCELGDYDQAMPLLMAMDSDDVLHNLIAKAMLIKMYWETNEWGAMESLLSSLSVYIRRKRQVTEQQRMAFQHFIRFVRLIQALLPGDKAARKTLQEEILNATVVVEKEWLLRII